MASVPFLLRSPMIKLREQFQSERQVLILYYHRVLPQIKRDDPLLLQTSLENFEQQMTYLAETYTIISLHELLNQIASGEFCRKRQIVVTFDDGYRDNYLYAYPILKKLKVPATIFLTVEHIDTQSLFLWERLISAMTPLSPHDFQIDVSGILKYSLRSQEDKSCVFFSLHKYLKTLAPRHAATIVGQLEKTPQPVDEEDLPLAWAQIQEMHETHISFGTHTLTHPQLSGLEFSEVEREILFSKERIEEQLQCNVSLFAYPYGEASDFNSTTVSILQQHHFLCGCSTIAGLTKLPCDVFALKRNVVRNWDVVTFARKIAHVFQYDEWLT